MASTLRLVDGTTQIMLKNAAPGYADPIFLTSFDLGFPAPRETKYELPGQSGEQDLTYLHDGRTVSLSIKVFGDATYSKEQYMEWISSLCHPSKRPLLYVQMRNYSGERVMTLRANPFTNTITKQAAAFYEVTLQFVCPLGLMTDTVQQYIVLYPLSLDVGFSLTAAASSGWTAAGVGFSMPSGAYTDNGWSSPALTGLSLSAADFRNVATVGNTGSVSASPTMKIFGAVTDPVIVNTTTNRTFAFTGLTVVAGSWLEIDVAARTVTLNGDPGQNMYGYVDWTKSDWWDLVPGENVITYTGTNIDSTAQLNINFYRRWI